MDTIKEKVIVNNLLQETSNIYRMSLHLPFIVYVSSR